MNTIKSGRRKQEVLLDKAGTISFTPYKNNQVAVASAATVQVMKPSGEVIVAAGTSASVSAAGVISYSLTAGNNDVLGENFKAVFTYTISSVDYYATILYDVVRSILDITVIDADILEVQNDLLSKSESFSGSVDSATSTTIVDGDLKNYADDYWNGGLVEVVLPSTGAKQSLTITDFTQSTGTVTTGTWGTTPDNTYRYVVRRGFQKKIEAAFDEIMFALRAKGNRPALILESSEIHQPLLKKSLQLICKDYMKEPGDKWDELSKTYLSEYIDAMDKVRLQYDTNQDGVIAGTEANKDIGQIRLIR